MRRDMEELLVDQVRRHRISMWLSVAAAACALAVVVVNLCGCGARQAQNAVQASLTSLAEGVHGADAALAAAMPAIREKAVADARARCAAESCPDATVYLDELFGPADRAVDGLEVARESLYLAQDAQDAWVASGSLPDTDPICETLGTAAGDVPRLLDEAGVTVPEVARGLGPVAEAICRLFAEWSSR